MAPRFVFCPACNRPAHPHERQCPFCDAPFGPEATRSVGTGVALSVGLSLVAGCETQSALAQPRDARADAAAAPVADAGFPGLGQSGFGYGVYGAPPSALRRASGPVVRAMPPSVEGALPVEVVRRIVLRNINQVSFCFGNATDGGPAPTGRVVLRMDIDAQGAVTASRVEESTTAAPSVDACIATASRRWTFPAPARGTVTARVPYVVQAASP